MRRSSELLATVALLVSLGVGPVSVASASIHTRHVIILAIDGGRYTETLGDPTLTWHPRMGHDLAALGAMPARFENLGQTVTVPGMSALMTGTLQNVANDGSERPHAPTLCEYLRAATGLPDSLVRVVARKPKLDVLAYSDHPSYGAAYGGTVRAGFNSDLETFLEAHAELFNYRPKFMLIHLGDTDFLGHANNWPGYLASLHFADSLIWRLWTDIQADPELGGSTTLFVSNDHGRHDDQHGGFVNHGDACEGCRRIMLIVAGPDTRAGFVSTSHRDQRDVARTAGWLLGIPMPYATGAIMDEFLLEPSGPLAVGDDGAQGREPSLAVYPNPTRGAVSVRLSRGASATARVEVLDAAGGRVASFDPVPATDGSLAWTWNGRRSDGRAAPAGAYIVRVTEHGRSHQSRLVKLQ